MRIFSLILLFLCCISCGGGGGGSDSGSEDGNAELKRGTNTAIRIIHAGLDASPVRVRLADSVLQQSRFAEAQFYAETQDGPVEVVITRLDGSVFKSIPMELVKDTEYSLLLSGLSLKGNFDGVMLVDTTVRAEPNFTNLRVVNALNNAGTLSFAADLVDLGSVAERAASDFVLVPSGSVTLKATNKNGALIASKTISLPSRGELTVLLAGDTSLSYVVFQEFQDLD